MENNDINSNIETIDNPEPTENIGYNLFFAYLTVPLYMINVGFILFSILKDNVPRGLLNNPSAAKIVFFIFGFDWNKLSSITLHLSYAQKPFFGLPQKEFSFYYHFLYPILY